METKSVFGVVLMVVGAAILVFGVLGVIATSTTPGMGGAEVLMSIFIAALGVGVGWLGLKLRE